MDSNRGFINPVYALSVQDEHNGSTATVAGTTDGTAGSGTIAVGGTPGDAVCGGTIAGGTVAVDGTNGRGAVNAIVSDGTLGGTAGGGTPGGTVAGGTPGGTAVAAAPVGTDAGGTPGGTPCGTVVGVPLDGGAISDPSPTDVEVIVGNFVDFLADMSMKNQLKNIKHSMFHR